MPLKQDRLPFVFICIYFAAMCALAFLTNGTGDEGDSVSHYLFAKYAFKHTANFLDHWAKPMYVLIAAPFTQLGFVGVKLMNIGLSTLSAWFSYKIAKIFALPNAVIALLFVMLAPMHIYLTLSGLTEPLFAFWLIAAVFMAVRGQVTASVIWVSFLPFVRSEGLVILCVYFLYLLSIKKWRLLPLLFAGHVVFSIVGYFYLGSFWWVFTDIPYAQNSSIYGSGQLFHFINGLKNVLGLPMYILLGAGLVYGAIKLYQTLKSVSYRFITATELWLVYGCFLAYILAHTLFWYLGIFKSFGLLRVLVGVVPLAAIICLRGLNILSDLWGNKIIAKKGFVTTVVALVFAFTLFGQNWKTHLLLRADQVAQMEMANYIGNRFEGYKYYFDAPFIAMALNVDMFDQDKKEFTAELFKNKPIPDKSLIIWDDWYSVMECQTKLEMITQDSRFDLLRSFEAGDQWGNHRKTYLFKKKQFTFNNNNAETTLFTTSFEQQPTADSIRIDSLHAFEGKFSAIVSNAAPYSLGFDLPMSEIANATGKILHAEAQILINQNEPNQYKQPIMVISFENEKSYNWTPINLQDLVPEGRWQKVSFETTIPAAQTLKDHVKVYVYNPSSFPVYLDDLIISINK